MIGNVVYCQANIAGGRRGPGLFLLAQGSVAHSLLDSALGGCSGRDVDGQLAVVGLGKSCEHLRHLCYGGRNMRVIEHGRTSMVSLKMLPLYRFKNL